MTRPTLADRFWNEVYWLARLPSIVLQLAWEPQWKWVNRGYPSADGATKRQDGPVHTPNPASPPQQMSTKGRE